MGYHHLGEGGASEILWVRGNDPTLFRGKRLLELDHIMPEDLLSIKAQPGLALSGFPPGREASSFPVLI